MKVTIDINKADLERRYLIIDKALEEYHRLKGLEIKIGDWIYNKQKEQIEVAINDGVSLDRFIKLPEKLQVDLDKWTEENYTW